MSFAEIGTEIGKLVEEKNAAYGSSFQRSGDVMRILYPDGIPPEKLDDALAVIRVIDKLFRIAHAANAFGESPWKDLAGYGILGEERARRTRPSVVVSVAPVHVTGLSSPPDGAAEAVEVSTVSDVEGKATRRGFFR